MSDLMTYMNFKKIMHRNCVAPENVEFSAQKPLWENRDRCEV